MPRGALSTSAYAAIADPTRRAILDRLRTGERAVSELQESLPGVSQSALSQHLAVLRRARLVTPRPEGRRRLYRIRKDALADVAEWVAHFGLFWGDRLARLGRHLDRKERP